MRAMADNPVYKSFDADRDGTVTTGEAEAGITALHAKYDTDGNGRLSADEFKALFAEVTRGFAERPFAMLDADGNKEISAEEMRFPAQMMGRMQSWQGSSPFWGR
jgi:Ca2+-binding EF-hand superfamily protein